MKVAPRAMAPPRTVPPKRKSGKVTPSRMAKRTTNSLDFQYKVYRKLGPLYPVYRKNVRNVGSKRKGKSSYIKSWRCWVQWSDGDWTAETRKAFKKADWQKVENMIKKGSEVWPWPSSNTPLDGYRVTELKQLRMRQWKDSGTNIWTLTPQTEKQVDDTDHDCESATEKDTATSDMDDSDETDDGSSRLSSTEESEED